MSKSYNALTDAQITALSAHVASHGDSWKTALFSEWIRGTAHPDLLALRRTHGFAWLTSYAAKSEDEGRVRPYLQPDICPYCETSIAVCQNYPSGSAEYICHTCDHRWGRTVHGAIIDLRPSHVAAE